mgnify:CR=1 FL=1
MNLLSDYQIKIHNFLKKLNDKKVIFIPNNLQSLTIELPPKNNQADISCNAALILSKFNKKEPIVLAEILKEKFIENFKEFGKIDIAKPGFININFTPKFWKKYLSKILIFNKKYGSNKNIKKKYNIEFVSANPTGPLHVGHCRGAILGDVISNLLKFNGHYVLKEYYVNDYGQQINTFVFSVYYRILELVNNKKFPNDKNLYPGEYIVDIAKKIIKEKKIKNFTNLEKILKKLSKESLKISIGIIKNNLKDLGIKHDKFVYESDLVSKGLVNKTVNKLKKNKYVYTGKLKPPKGDINEEWKIREQLLFRSTKFGDDVDRALQKEDNTWTYFASDIAYHDHKLKRNFDFLINILGSDHAGYIKRITAVVNALSKNKINLTCKVSQLVKLYKDGLPFKMSKREGNYITVEDLIKEVGKDSTRFMMLNRSNDVELDFDFQKVTEKSKDNPVFYVQYAYARINSIFRNLKLNINKKMKLEKEQFLLNEYEINILKKIAEWPRCVEVSSNKLEPHRIPFFLYDLAVLFHSYWSLGKDNKNYRFISESGKSNIIRLSLLQAMAIVIKNGMSILGVTTPKSM